MRLLFTFRQRSRVTTAFARTAGGVDILEGDDCRPARDRLLRLKVGVLPVGDRRNALTVGGK